MIEFSKFTLENGLKVIVHRDQSTPIVAINMLYNVGAKDENPEKTGFAHLFEHLMFGGSINIPIYDEPLQIVGGDNNAFTNNDITNYYLTLPKANIETGFWLESDRMLSLAFSEKSLDVQRNVVIEEFKQRYLNQPYGDIWLLLRPLVYKVHPYQWATIGKEISHIENATIEDVKEFFYQHYAPNNAIMVVAGDVTEVEIRKLTEKWFSPIPKRKVKKRMLPQEPKQNEYRELKVERDVPFDSITMAYHMCGRMHKDYYGYDLLSDILSNGKSSILYQKLIKEKRLFADIDAYISGSIEAGLFIISGTLHGGVDMKIAKNAIQEIIDEISTKKVNPEDLIKVKNKTEANLQFSEIDVLNKAMNLAHFELLGNANMINEEIEKYQKVNEKDILRLAKKVFVKENCSTLYYYAKK
ncbi:MAG TPA: peptidase M16 [Bacteroidales bacterium]|nr:MAG: peptidase M16 [Bacteroidetes bacterium GWF2_33_38]OFY74474.1 MAG: peptidase M16 [Bacteroidetes bacterium RIFOXYA12_FULL_33_9]OFY86080.1 MAG: peptidase M16 [Bacteroidetes bacterium RIFOXYA2_FULL_33_7]HBF87663.1 peptidase M16 [Bacteroidales bacterium]